MRMHVGSADVGGLVEVVEFDEPGDLSLDERHGHRPARALAAARDRRRPYTGHVAALLRLAGRAIGHHLRPGVAPDGRAHPRAHARQPATMSSKEEGRNWPSQVGVSPVGSGTTLGSAKVLVDAGVDPADPAGQARQGARPRWPASGRSPAAGTISLATRFPDETMIVDELGTLTFGEVHRRTNALAHALSDAGIKEGDGVGIMCRNHRGFIESTVAVSKLGADALYLNTAFAGPAAGRGGQAGEAGRRSSTTRSSPGCSRRPASGASASWPGTTPSASRTPPSTT